MTDDNGATTGLGVLMARSQGDANWYRLRIRLVTQKNHYTNVSTPDYLTPRILRTFFLTYLIQFQNKIVAEDSK